MSRGRRSGGGCPAPGCNGRLSGRDGTCRTCLVAWTPEPAKPAQGELGGVADLAAQVSGQLAIEGVE